MLWDSDFAYVSTWAGFTYIAFVIDAYTRALSAGVSAGQRMRASCPTRWSRHSMRGAPCIAPGLFTTATGAASASENSQISPSTTVRAAQLTVTVRTSLLSCTKAGKTQIFTPVRKRGQCLAPIDSRAHRGPGRTRERANNGGNVRSLPDRISRWSAVRR